MLLPIIGIASAMGLHETHSSADPTLIQQWIFSDRYTADGHVEEVHHRLTGRLHKGASVTSSGGLLLDGLDSMVEIGELQANLQTRLPVESFTVSAWVLIESPTEWGGIVGVIQDNAEHEEGWLLGYRHHHFCFAVAGTDPADPDGNLTYLQSEEPMTLNQWHHVAGVYDGHKMQLWIDGRLAAESNEQTGPIQYPKKGRMVIGAYLDANEYIPLEGAIQHVRIRNIPCSQSQIHDEMAAYPDMRGEDAPDRPLKLLVGPHLQNTQQDAITVMWETTKPSEGRVEYGHTANLGKTAPSAAAGRMHEVTIGNLPTETNWFYRIVSTGDGEEVTSPVLTFQTKIQEDTPVGFIVVGDTQNNPTVTAMMSQHAWSHRPHFIMHCGDLVGTGTTKREWVHDFFGSTGDLLGRYPIYPTLGNHERDAELYYDYFSLPEPEYYYEYRWGSVHVFVLDTNKDVSSGSAQHQWLDSALSQSNATWKIIQHHQPAWTSDSNDYGDTYQAGSTWGDLNIRNHLVPLYEKHGVDIVFNGHIHVYERTWPLTGEHVDLAQGVTYVTTGGGGGWLEDFAPTRTWFTAHKHRGHHYCLVTAHEGEIEVRAFDSDGKLIDFFTRTANGSGVHGQSPDE